MIKNITNIMKIKQLIINLKTYTYKIITESYKLTIYYVYYHLKQQDIGASGSST